VNDRTGHSTCDARHHLHPSDHQLAELVDTGGFGADDDVVRTRHIFGQCDALDCADRMRDLSRLADIGLDQDVCLYDHQVVPPEFQDALSKTGVSSHCQGASPVRDRRPRTLADVRHATSFDAPTRAGDRGRFQ